MDLTLRSFVACLPQAGTTAPQDDNEKENQRQKHRSKDPPLHGEPPFANSAKGRPPTRAKTTKKHI